MKKKLLLLIGLISFNFGTTNSYELTPKEEFLTQLLLELTARKDKELAKILETVDCTLEATNDIINQQQKMLTCYKRANNIKLIILTAITSTILTATTCKYQKEITKLIQDLIIKLKQSNITTL